MAVVNRGHAADVSKGGAAGSDTHDWEWAVRQDVAMTETNWARLRRIVDARLDHLGMTQVGLRAAGGPSTAWVRSLGKRSGLPTSREFASLEELDLGLRWTPGTARGLLLEDRSTFDAESLEAEEADLIESDDEWRGFAVIVESRLRTLAVHDRDAALAMRAALWRVLDMPGMP